MANRKRPVAQAAPEPLTPLPESVALWPAGPCPELGAVGDEWLVVQSPEGGGRVQLVRCLESVTYADVVRLLEQGRLLPGQGQEEVIGRALAAWRLHPAAHRGRLGRVTGAAGLSLAKAALRAGRGHLTLVGGKAARHA